MLWGGAKGGLEVRTSADGATRLSGRFTGTAGDDGEVPDDVHEAYARLYQYFRGIGNSAWEETAVYAAGERQAPAGWAAKAMNLSGAADLLRPYRRLGVQ